MDALSSSMPISRALSARPSAAVNEAAAIRAVVQTGYGGPEVLTVGTTARPSPGEGEVLVEVHAAGMDRGTWHLTTGRPYLMRVMGFGFRGPKHPVAGLDVAGTVVEVGPKVTRFSVGDRVFGIGIGSFGELARAREDKLARVPERLSLEEAAVLGVSGLTALQALERGQARAGDRVLVIGASGGVGSYAVQIARALGAEVTGVCSEEKRAFVRSLGAVHTIDYRTKSFADGSVKYDLILDIGGNTELSRLRRAMTAAGRVVFVGGEHGGDYTAGFGRILLAMMLAPFVKQRFLPFAATEHFEGLERLAALADAGELRPAIDRRISLDEVPAALRDLEAGKIRGKVVVKIA
jgi:NADPH:quinone reductase-like Zn-dependent oxidoreductase